MSGQIQLYDILMAKAPVLVLHEPDARYARRGPADIVAHVRNMPLLEWTRDLGWKASEARAPELFARTGFSEASPLLTPGGTSEDFDAQTLHKFVDWIVGSLQTASSATSHGEPHPFHRGLLICHDMASPTRGREPGFLRVIQSLGDVLGSPEVAASAIFTTTHALPPDHPLLAICPQIQPLDEPWRRLGALLLQGARQLQVGPEEPLAQHVLLPALQRLSHAGADFVLRMLLIQHARFRHDHQRSWTGPELSSELQRLMALLMAPAPVAPR